MLQRDMVYIARESLNLSFRPVARTELYTSCNVFRITFLLDYGLLPCHTLFCKEKCLLVVHDHGQGDSLYDIVLADGTHTYSYTPVEFNYE